MDFAIPTDHRVKLKESEKKDKCLEGARGVIVIVVGNEHGDTSSNPGRD